MKHLVAFCITTVLVLSCLVAARAQGESPIATRIVQVLKLKKPNWKPIVGIESTHVPVVPTEKRILVATWYSDEAGGFAEGINVRLYQVENRSEAEKWLKPISRGVVAQGWRVRSYGIGDRGFLAEYQSGKRFAIQFRKGNVVGEVAGNSLAGVKEFAQLIIAEVPRES